MFEIETIGTYCECSFSASVLLKFGDFQLVFDVTVDKKVWAKLSSAKEEKVILCLWTLGASQRKWRRCSLLGSEKNEFVQKVCSLQLWLCSPEEIQLSAGLGMRIIQPSTVWWFRFRIDCVVYLVVLVRFFFFLINGSRQQWQLGTPHTGTQFHHRTSCIRVHGSSCFPLACWVLQVCLKMACTRLASQTLWLALLVTSERSGNQQHLSDLLEDYAGCGVCKCCSACRCLLCRGAVWTIVSQMFGGFSEAL